MFLVYIKEAHPSDGIAIAGETKLGSGWELKQQKTLAERLDSARKFHAALGAKSPYFCDGIGNDAMNAFVSWPERLFVIVDGVFEFVGGYGPKQYDVGELQYVLSKRCGAGNVSNSGSCDVKELLADVVNFEAKFSDKEKER